MPDREDMQECVVLSFSGRQMSLSDQAALNCTAPVGTDTAVQKAPEGVQRDAEDLQVAVNACVADINRNADTITKAMMNIKDMVHEFSDFVKKCDR